MKADLPQSEGEFSAEEEYHPASERQQKTKPRIPKEKLAPHPQQFGHFPKDDRKRNSQIGQMVSQKMDPKSNNFVT